MALFRRSTSGSANTDVATETKASQTGPLVYLQSHGQPVWTNRNYTALSKEGYTKNVIVYRSVRMIADAVSSIPLMVETGSGELDQHPVLDVLRKPNARQSGNELIDALICNLMLSGNAYLEAVLLNDELRELHVLRPDRVTIVAGDDGWPCAYEYSAGGATVRFNQADSAMPPILQLMLHSPLDDHYGFAPIQAAQMALDIHNVASAWNKALLDNAARPSGALVYQGGEGNLTEDQFDRLKSELEASFQGARNAGRPLLLEGGLDWKAMSMTPRDMDFFEAHRSAAREIALAFGVPPQLLGIPGDNTYSNYQEANRAFWRQTIMPLLGKISTSLQSWLQTLYGNDLCIKFDETAISALSTEKDARLQRLVAADFLTINEKRAALNYGPIENGDVL